MTGEFYVVAPCERKLIFDHIKRLITLSSDCIKRLSLLLKLLLKLKVDYHVFRKFEGLDVDLALITNS